MPVPSPRRLRDLLFDRTRRPAVPRRAGTTAAKPEALEVRVLLASAGYGGGTSGFGYLDDGAGTSSTTDGGGGAVVLQMNTFSPEGAGGSTPGRIDDTPVTWLADFGTDPGHGGLALKQDLVGGLELAYRSDFDGRPVVAVEVDRADFGNADGNRVAVSLYSGGGTLSTTHFDVGPDGANRLRFAVRPDAALADGRHDVQIGFGYTVGGQPQLSEGGTPTRTVLVEDRSGSEYGTGWTLSGLERLTVDAGGATYHDGGQVREYFAGDPAAGASGSSRLRGSTLTGNPDGTYTLAGRRGGVSEFDAAGRVTAQRNPNGQTITYAYDAAGRVETVTDDYQRQTTLTYGTDGLLDAVVDWAGRTVTLTHDANGGLDTVTRDDPDGAGAQTAPVTDYGYTGGLVTTITDAAGGVLEFAHDHGGRLATADVRSAARRHTFTAAATVGLPGAGQGTSANPFSAVAADADVAVWTRPGNQSTTTTFNEFGAVASVTDARGFTTTYDHTAAGVTRTGPDPDGAGLQTAAVWTDTYAANGDRTAATGPEGWSENWTYDATGAVAGHVLSDPDGPGGADAPDWSYAYDARGNRLTATDPLGHTTSRTYDADGNVTSMTEADPDGAGPLAAAVWNYTYDLFGRLSEVENPLSSTTAYTYTAADLLATVRDAAGRVTTYTYDALDRLVSVLAPDPDGPGAAGPLAAPETKFTHDPFGRLLTTTDPSGAVTTNHYDLEGDLTGVTESDPHTPGDPGGFTQFYYGADGRRTGVRDAGGNLTGYAYDADGNLRVVAGADPDGAGPLVKPITINTHDGLGRLLTSRDPQGFTTSYDYDGQGRVTGVSLPDPDGNGPRAAATLSYSYDALGRLLTETDGLGHVTAHAYDANGRRTGTTLPDPDGNGPLTSPTMGYGYDALGRLTSETDPRGAVTTYIYDKLGRLTSTTLPDPDGGGPLSSPVYSATYDTVGNVLSETDPLGARTGYSYDKLDRLLTVTTPDPDGAGSQIASVYEYGYDANGRRTSARDPLGEVTTTAYDLLGRVTSVTDPYLHAETHTYDAVGNRLTATDRVGDTTVYEYDALNRLTTVTPADPDGAGPQVSPVTSYGYDRRGLRTSETNGLGQTTTWDYDGWGLMTRETPADPDAGGPLASPVTVYGYDAAGRRTSLKDPTGNTTSWTYDTLGRVLTETNATNATRAWAYDAAGNALSYTDRDGRESAYTYDLLGRQTSEAWLDGAAVLDTITRTFDAAGRLTKITDGDSTKSYVRDLLGRVTLSANGGTPDAPHQLLYNSYDRRGRRNAQSLRLDGTWDYRTTFGFDDAARTRLIHQRKAHSTGNAVSDKRVTLTYDANGRFDTVARYDDLLETKPVAETAYGYDHAGGLTDIDHTTAGGTVTLAAYDYAFDAANRLTSTASLTDGVTTFAHDANGQLTSADHASQTDEAFTYDAAGNRTNTGYNTGTANRLLSDGTHTYEYDAEGRRTKKTETATGDYATYEWDHGGNLTTVSLYLSWDFLYRQVTYRYDGHGRKITKDVDDDGNGPGDRVEHYVWDGEGGFGHVDDIVLVTDGQGNVLHRYLHGPATDMVFADENGMGEVLWGLGDHQRTVRDWVEYDDVAEEGVVSDHVGYDAFGNITGQTDPSRDVTVGYTGRHWDADARLYDYRARWYDPAAGRFVSEDPLGFAAGDANLQRYVGNGVSSAVDPTGLEVHWYNPFTWFEPWYNQAVPDEVDYEPLYEQERDILDLINRHSPDGTQYDNIGDVPDDVLRGMGVPEDVIKDRESPQDIYDDALGDAQANLGAAEGALHVADAAATAADLAAGGAGTAGRAAAGEALEQGIRRYGDDAVEIIIDGNRFPASARHTDDAIRSGVSPRGTVNRAGAKPRRDARLKDEPTVPGRDRDEFPPAVLDNGQGGHSVKPISPGDNRGAGASIGGQLRGVPDGTPVIIVPRNVPR